MPRKKARPQKDEDELPPPRRSARPAQPRQHFDGMLDLAKISNAELAGRKTPRLRNANACPGTTSRTTVAKRSPCPDVLSGRRKSRRIRKPATRPAGCIDLASVSTTIVAYDGPLPKRRKATSRLPTVPDTDSPEESSSSSELDLPQRKPLQTISGNRTNFHMYDAPPSSGSAFQSHAGSRIIRSPSSSSSPASETRRKLMTAVVIPSRSGHSTSTGLPLPVKPFQSLVGDDRLEDSALTDLRDINTPDFQDTQGSHIREVEQSEGSALTDLRDVETPACPFTQSVARDEASMEDSLLTDIRDIDTPAFPFTQPSAAVGRDEDDYAKSEQVFSIQIENPHTSDSQGQANFSDRVTSFGSNFEEILSFQIGESPSWNQKLVTQEIVVSQQDSLQMEVFDREDSQDLRRLASAKSEPMNSGVETQQDSLMPGVPVYLEHGFETVLSDPVLPGAWPQHVVEIPALRESQSQQASLVLYEYEQEEESVRTAMNESVPFRPSESMGDTDMRELLAGGDVNNEGDDLEYEALSQSSCSSGAETGSTKEAGK